MRRETERATNLLDWPSVEANVYLDCRHPHWIASEQRGEVVYKRIPGQRRARVYVDPTRTEIVEALPEHARQPTGDATSARRRTALKKGEAPSLT
jgi:hypothetical protein